MIFGPAIQVHVCSGRTEHHPGGRQGRVGQQGILPLSISAAFAGLSAARPAPPPNPLEIVMSTSHGRTAEDVARAFHETYERLAPEYGYKTREASAVPWADVPASNKSLMVAVVAELLDKGTISV